MAKQQGRKPPKRAPKRHREIDDDLANIALALEAGRLDNNAAGWFSIPWRDGWNAVELAFVQACRLDFSEQLAPLDHWIRNRSNDATSYWDAGELLEVWTPHKIVRAALRCYQTLVARSDGGGEVYNAILRPVFEIELPESVAEIVLVHRRRDALGGSRSIARVNAFNTAWRRGLYRAAYAL